MDGWMEGLFLNLRGEKYRDSSYLKDYLFIFFFIYRRMYIHYCAFSFIVFTHGV